MVLGNPGETNSAKIRVIERAPPRARVGERQRAQEEGETQRKGAPLSLLRCVYHADQKIDVLLNC